MSQPAHSLVVVSNIVDNKLDSRHWVNYFHRPILGNLAYMIVKKHKVEELQPSLFCVQKKV